MVGQRMGKRIACAMNRFVNLLCHALFGCALAFMLAVVANLV